MLFNLNKILIITGVAALALFLAFLFWWQWEGATIGYENKQESGGGRHLASLTGLECENYSRRPVAVMMASDPIARPLSGIGQADIVFEMPVTPNGITRMMAVFQCEEPQEIGSVRSAREDFLTFVKSFDALYAHWGGEREALNKLDSGVLDNIDGMKYEGTVFYRKNSKPRPHNGFTTLSLITEKAKELGYILDDSFPGFIRENIKIDRNLSNLVSMVSVDYPSPYDVKWVYDNDSGRYRRSRGGEIESDINNNDQVQSDVIVVMHTTSKFLSRDYISINTTGEGEAEFYQNGVRASGKWKNVADDLKFYDINGQEMTLVPGKIWIEIII